ncbi:hypothetical protein HDU79_009589 [Rhizoclosmatium sp. JEL0117]|nr:hypothetical protein HDU79_009589 [Rhizoclosmatium sp. JEL0117]
MAQKEKGSPNTLLPVFSGIDSAKLVTSHAMKSVKTPIFMFCFLIIDLMFRPIEIGYGHMNEGSRTSAVLGLLAVVNVAVLRASLQYLQMNPLDSVTTVVFYHLQSGTTLLRKVEELESDEPEEESQG